jgi:hypothetical protein
MCDSMLTVKDGPGFYRGLFAPGRGPSEAKDPIEEGRGEAALTKIWRSNGSQSLAQ